MRVVTAVHEQFRKRGVEAAIATVPNTSIRYISWTETSLLSMSILYRTNLQHTAINFASSTLITLLSHFHQDNDGLLSLSAIGRESASPSFGEVIPVELGIAWSWKTGRSGIPVHTVSEEQRSFNSKEFRAQCV